LKKDLISGDHFWVQFWFHFWVPPIQASIRGPRNSGPKTGPSKSKFFRRQARKIWCEKVGFSDWFSGFPVLRQPSLIVTRNRSGRSRRDCRPGCGGTLDDRTKIFRWTSFRLVCKLVAEGSGQTDCNAASSAEFAGKGGPESGPAEWVYFWTFKCFVVAPKLGC